MEEKKTIRGRWAKERVLGVGAFAVVSLWKHLTTGQLIAIKSFKDVTQDGGRRRSTREIEMMKKLRHDNLVNFVPTPDEFRLISKPILCMEYCRGGNLRTVLNEPENCSGLPERIVKQCLGDVKSVLAYLHGQNIIHRDLKPENILLQNINDNVIFKLIDLGFGEELEQTDSLGGANVNFPRVPEGTLEYVAPDVFLEGCPTPSVDYWSFGVICHEIITGFRPFLPHISPYQWIEKVRFKSDDVICVYELPFGDPHDNIVFSERLASENNLTKALADNLEFWLRLALRMDYKSRGRNKQNQLIIFSSLEEILSKKIISLFNFSHFEIISYVINESTTTLDLKRLISADYSVPAENQEILSLSGDTVGDDENIVKYWNPTCEGVMVHLFTTEGISMPNDTPEPSSTLVAAVQDVKENLPYYKRKKIYSNAIHYMRTQVNLRKAFNSAIKAYLSSIEKSVKALTSLETFGWNRLEHCYAKLDILQNSVRYNEERFNQGLNPNGETPNIFEKQKKMLNSFKVATDKLKKRLVVYSGTLVDIKNRLGEANACRNITDDTKETEKSLKKAYLIMKGLIQLPKELRLSEGNCSEMVNLMMEFFREIELFKENETLLKSIEHCKTCKKSISALHSKFHNVNCDLYTISRDTVIVEQELFEIVWDLLLPTKLDTSTAGKSLASPQGWAETANPSSRKSMPLAVTRFDDFSETHELIGKNTSLHHQLDDALNVFVHEFTDCQRMYDELNNSMALRGTNSPSNPE